MFFYHQSLVRKIAHAASLVALLAGTPYAKPSSDEPEIGELDSVASFQDIETVEVTATAVNPNKQTGSILQVSKRQVDFLQPNSLADVFTLVPSANVRVNSRGETLVSLRGAGERQLAVFFDGVPINVPWDNRFDLRLIPSLMIGTVNVSTGPTASGYGANTAGGIIKIVPERSANSEVLLEGGRGAQWAAEAKAGFVSGNFRTTVAVSHSETDGFAAPGGGASAFSAPGSSLITNTDRAQSNFLLRTTNQGDNSRVGVSVLYSKAAFGIAPEQGARVDPSSARYWRFPDTEHILASGNYQVAFGDVIDIEAVGWYQSFDQRINSFEDVTYAAIEEVQQDKNRSLGTRVRIGYRDEIQQLAITATSQWASHEQQEFEPQATFRIVDEFSQFSGSVGGDYNLQLSSSTSLSLGASYDVLGPRETAGRGQGAKFDGLNASFELQLATSDRWQLRLGAARKVRLPTLRELFGEAIGRFVINPDLVPEVSWVFEVAAGFQNGSGSFDIIPFWVETSQTLDQTRVLIEGKALRKRVNLPGSRTYGIETRMQWQVSDALSFSADATWSKSRAKTESVAISVRRLYLSDRPNWLAQAAAKYQVGTRTTFGLSVVHRGAAKSEDDAGLFLDLSAATQVNMALSHKINLAQSGFDMELFARLDNLTDTFVEPQLGLPNAGRSFTLGLNAVF